MGKLTVLLQVDAFRHDYLEKNSTPFLYSLFKDSGSGVLKPTFGFEPDAAYIAGLYPDEADGGAQFWFDADMSPFKIFQYAPKVLSNLPHIPDRVLRKIIQKLVGKYCDAPTFSTASVPLHLLHNFSFPMQHRMHHPNFCASKSIFDLLREQNKKWLFHCNPDFKVSLEAVIQRVKTDLLPPIEFSFFLIGDLDRIGHRYGPESKELKEELMKIDIGLNTILNFAKERFDEVNFMVIGDHGMVQVNETLDVQNIISRLPNDVLKNCHYFLDSTMARFWFTTEKAKEAVVSILNGIECGHMISQEEKDRYHLNYKHNKFGDLIFIVNPGVLIHPSFYGTRTPVKGMHGYLPEISGQQSLWLLNSTKINYPVHNPEPLDMRRVFPTLVALSELELPEACKLKKLYD